MTPFLVQDGYLRRDVDESTLIENERNEAPFLYVSKREKETRLNFIPRLGLYSPL